MNFKIKFSFASKPISFHARVFPFEILKSVVVLKCVLTVLCFAVLESL